MVTSLCRPGSVMSNPIPRENTEWQPFWNDRPYVYIQTPDGTVTKVYRSYSDYCED